jgi:hypothetical protein
MIIKKEEMISKYTVNKRIIFLINTILNKMDLLINDMNKYIESINKTIVNSIL